MSLDPKQAAFMREGLLAKLESEHRAMSAVLSHLPEDKMAYKPHEKVRPFGELAFHIYTTGMWFTDIASSGKADFAASAGPKPETPPSKAALLLSVQKMNQEMTAKIAEMTPEALARNIEFGSFGTYPAVAFVDWHLSHLTHHRGQLTVYLRTMGAKVPATYGDSLDYPMSM